MRRLIPALRMRMSRMGKACCRVAVNARMLVLLLTSRGRTLMVGFLDLMAGSWRRDCLQAWPLDSLRTARMRVERLRVRSWRAVSRPRPALEPVITADLPWRLMSDGKGFTLGWKSGMLEVNVCMDLISELC